MRPAAGLNEGLEARVPVFKGISVQKFNRNHIIVREKRQMRMNTSQLKGSLPSRPHSRLDTRILVYMPTTRLPFALADGIGFMCRSLPR